MAAPIAGGMAGSVFEHSGVVVAIVLIAFVAFVGVCVGKAVHGTPRRRKVVGGAAGLAAGLVAYVAAVIAAIAACDGCLS